LSGHIIKSIAGLLENIRELNDGYCKNRWYIAISIARMRKIIPILAMK
jgi:hypothetical protein